MAISLDRIIVGANESILVQIQGSVERSLCIQVSKSGRCFVSGPFNNNRKLFELSIDGMREVPETDRDEALGL